MLSIGTVSIADRLVAVAGAFDGTVRAWDIVGSTEPNRPLRAPDPLLSVATAEFTGGRVVAITGGADGSVLGWDLNRWAPLAVPLRGHPSAVVAVSTARLTDGRLVVVTGDTDGTVLVQDLAGEKVLATVTDAHAGGVTALTAAELGRYGRTIVVTAAAAPAVMMWELPSGAPLGDPLPVPGTVRALAVPHRDPPVLVIGGAGLAVAEIGNSRDGILGGTMWQV